MRTGIYAKHLKEEVIESCLNGMGDKFYSESAVNLLLGTAAQESHMGTYLKQIKGPALGIFQMEPATHKDVWVNWLSHNRNVADTILNISFFAESDDFDLYQPCFDFAKTFQYSLISNLFYATAMARIHYYRVPEHLPNADDWEGLAKYWKKYYNTKNGKGTVEEFLENAKGFDLIN